MPLDTVSQVLLVLSGKGGVGKSSVTLQLALSLTQQGHNVGILDIDLTGPSIPRLLGLEEKKVTQAPGGWLPVEVHKALPLSEQTTNGTNGSSNIESTAPSQPQSSSELHNGSTPAQSPRRKRRRGSLHALSLAFLLPSRSSAVIWRGPKKTAMIRQFISDVLWPPETDFLVIDTPPGTSDEHIAVVEELHKLSLPGPLMAAPGPRLAGAVVVTTPQAVATSDVRKELNFCAKTSVPVLGVIENMSGYMCPCCGEVSKVFGKGGGEVMSREMGVRFLGSVPIDSTFGEIVEGKIQESETKDAAQADTLNGSIQEPELLVEKYSRCGLSKIFSDFATRIDGLLQGELERQDPA